MSVKQIVHGLLNNFIEWFLGSQCRDVVISTWVPGAFWADLECHSCQLAKVWHVRSNTTAINIHILHRMNIFSNQQASKWSVRPGIFNQSRVTACRMSVVFFWVLRDWSLALKDYYYYRVEPASALNTNGQVDHDGLLILSQTDPHNKIGTK